MKAGKIWGQTELIHANGVLEFHRIEFKKGFKCSEHEHKFKWNGDVLYKKAKSFVIHSVFSVPVN